MPDWARIEYNTVIIVTFVAYSHLEHRLLLRVATLVGGLFKDAPFATRIDAPTTIACRLFPELKTLRFLALHVTQRMVPLSELCLL